MSINYFEEEEFKTGFNGGTLKRIFALLKPHRMFAAAFLGMILMSSLVDAGFTYLSKLIIDEGIVAKNLDRLYELVTLYGGMIVVQAIFVFGFIYAVGILGEKVRYDLRKRMFNHLQDLSLSYYSRTPVGWIMARVTSDSDRVSDLVTWGLLDITWSTTNIIIALALMFWLDWQLALIVLISVPVLIVVAVEFRKRILEQYRNVRKINSKITGTYNENITGVRVVKALGREDANAEEFAVLTKDMYKAGYRAAWLSALFLPSVQLITAFAVGGIVYFTGIKAEIGGVSIGTLQAFLGYVTFMMWPIQDMARVFAEMQHAVASAERIFSLTDSVPEVANRPEAYDPGSMQGDIEFDHVTFYYEDNIPVIKDLSLHVKRGETIALVGPTGGGKSTLVNLVCRFYEPKEGQIRIGGVDYTKYSLHAIHSRIGIVLQTPHLFSGSIRDNIRYGRLNATDEEIEEAAKLAGAHDFILKQEKGYDSPVGEGGNNLSVGQKQLISLTRAILAKPEIFVMDEATSSVDTLTEALIQRGMESLQKGRTSFVIAHRLSTIRRADRILVIEDGQIAEMGTHSELLRLKGKYYHLYTRQFRHEMEVAFDPFLETVKAEN
ncbi:MAG: ABC transporter ATP-binding protein [Anaerolineaceae bacterium]|nr:ABC transporter ATP-binding protein [Anaerolineaceae bacterium]